MRGYLNRRKEKEKRGKKSALRYIRKSDSKSIGRRGENTCTEKKTRFPRFHFKNCFFFNRATTNKKMKETVALELSFVNSNLQLLKEQLAELNSSVELYQNESR